MSAEAEVSPYCQEKRDVLLRTGSVKMWGRSGMGREKKRPS